MTKILLLNKPFQVLCQFRDKDERKTLAHFVDTDKYPGFYAAGRLDYDSEGLLVLTDNGKLQDRITNPAQKMEKTYWVQVEGEPDETALQQLKTGVELKDGRTLPASVSAIPEPTVWQRDPPIRVRQNQGTSWLQLVISEGKNRQVRRMTAAVGHPTLRLIRTQIGPWSLADLQPGKLHETSVHLPQNKPSKPKRASHRKR